MPRNVSNIEKDEDAGLIFFVTYILPICSLDTSNVYSLICCILIVGFIFLLCWKTNLWFYNPILTLMGFKVYKFKFENEDDEKYAISKENILSNFNFKYINILENVYYVKGRENKK